MNATLSLLPVTETAFLYGLLGAGLCATCGIIAAFLHHSFCVELLSKPDRKNALAHFASPFNMQLLAMCVAVVGTYICAILQLATTQTFTIQLFMDICVATLELNYLRYSWARAGSIMEAVYPKLARSLKRLVFMAPLIFYAQTVPAALDAMCATRPDLAHILETGSVFEQALSSVAGITLFVFDVILLTGFTRHIQKLYQSMEMGEAARTDRFMIIARYGRVSCLVWIVSNFMYIGSLMLEQGSFLFWLLMVGLYVGSTLTVLTLYVMKLALYKCAGGVGSNVLSAKSLGVVGGSTATRRKEEVVSVKELVHGVSQMGPK
ncbi:hypothetical protein CcCBS67573_g01712 [Chytriomyces confervae]|uniref:Transmembrane protein n=1 Tax=Chytriomyces confervae TaxID=246404 RepID=A0A507FNX6_9FUNG|nr:hypothetical protein CcCBS67573_g01712 [Chytriomyces confervae]